MNWLDWQGLHSSEKPAIFGLDIFDWEEQTSPFAGNISRDALSLECEDRVNQEIDRILEIVSNKWHLETLELQIYSLYVTMETPSIGQLPNQRIKYKRIILGLLDFRYTGPDLD